MRGLLSPIIAILILSGCTPTETNRSSPTTQATDTLGIELPEEVHGLDNVNVYPSLDNPPYRIEFVEEQVLAPPEFYEFQRHYQIAAGDSGTAYIQKGTDIFAFDSDGNHIATMGGEGKGPGELSTFSSNEMRIHGKKLYIYDDQLARINIYSLETFKPSDTIDMDPRQWLNSTYIDTMWPGGSILKAPFYHPFGDGLLLMRFNRSIPLSQWRNPASESFRTFTVPSYFFPMNEEGEVVSEHILEIGYKMLILGEMSGMEALPMQARALMDVSDEKRIYWTDSGNFLIKITGPTGNLESVIYYPFEKLPIDLDGYENSYLNSGNFPQYLRNSDLPTEWPAITELIVDDKNRIWLASHSAKKDQYRWHVLDEGGSHITSFSWPADPLFRAQGQRAGIRDIRDGYLFAFVPEGGESPLYGNYVRYRIKLTERSSEDD